MSGVQLIDATLRIVELERENAALRAEIESLKDALAALAVATMPKREDEL